MDAVDECMSELNAVDRSQCDVSMRAAVAYVHGQCLRRLQRIDAAERQFRAAHQLQPAEPTPLVELGSALFDAGEHDGAYEALGRAVTLCQRIADEPHVAGDRRVPRDALIDVVAMPRVLLRGQDALLGLRDLDPSEGACVRVSVPLSLTAIVSAC